MCEGGCVGVMCGKWGNIKWDFWMGLCVFVCGFLRVFLCMCVHVFCYEYLTHDCSFT